MRLFIDETGLYKLSPSIVGTYKNEESLNIYYFNCAAKLANEFNVPQDLLNNT